MNPGTLYVVATPIGNLADMTERARQVLGTVDLIAAEDTRHTRKLMRALMIEVPLLAYHDYSEAEVGERLLAALGSGESVALVCDAGTPLIADPGFPLVRAARAAGIPVLPVPGPSAVLAALSVAGLPTARFSFEGFLPAAQAARAERLRSLRDDARTLVFFEAPHRIVASVAEMIAAFGAEREAFVAREMTKLFESHCRGSLATALEWLRGAERHRKGEFVVVVAGRPEPEREAQDLQRAVELAALLRGSLSLRDAARVAATFTGARKNQVYRQLLGAAESAPGETGR